MVAIRVIDDHLELANIGTKTHANIEGHIQGIGNYAFPAADGAINKILQTDGVGVLSWVDLPAGYTDAEAVAAADASNKFIERNVVNAVTGSTTLNRNSLGEVLELKNELSGLIFLSQTLTCTTKSTDQTTLMMYCDISFPYFRAIGTDQPYGLGYIKMLKNVGAWQTWFRFRVENNLGHPATPLEIHYNKLRFPSGLDIQTDTTNGTKIGTATNQKLGFFNTTPVVQQTAIANADGTLSDITTKFNALLTKQRNLGFIAT